MTSSLFLKIFFNVYSTIESFMFKIWLSVCLSRGGSVKRGAGGSETTF